MLMMRTGSLWWSAHATASRFSASSLPYSMVVPCKSKNRKFKRGFGTLPQVAPSGSRRLERSGLRQALPVAAWLHEGEGNVQERAHVGAGGRYRLAAAHANAAWRAGGPWFRLMSDTHARFCWTTRLCRVRLFHRGISLS